MRAPKDILRTSGHKEDISTPMPALLADEVVPDHVGGGVVSKALPERGDLDLRAVMAKGPPAIGCDIAWRNVKVRYRGGGGMAAHPGYEAWERTTNKVDESWQKV